jgi:hypothetical protein
MSRLRNSTVKLPGRRMLVTVRGVHNVNAVHITQVRQTDSQEG